jgi:hypothetical protein
LDGDAPNNDGNNYLGSISFLMKKIMTMTMTARVMAVSPLIERRSPNVSDYMDRNNEESMHKVLGSPNVVPGFRTFLAL